MALAVGTHLRTPDSTCEVIVVRGTDEDGQLTCAGGTMSDEATAGTGHVPADAPPVAMGKRYFDEQSGIELLVVKPGGGPLAFADRALELRAAKALPASD